MFGYVPQKQWLLNSLDNISTPEHRSHRKQTNHKPKINNQTCRIKKLHRIKTPENTKAAATETTIFKRQKNYKKKGTAATLPKRENTHNYCYYSQNYHRTKKKRQFHRTTTNFRRDRRLGFFFF